MEGSKYVRKYEKGKRPLNLKMEKFCQEYIITQEGATAAKNAGYSEKCAYEIASRLLRDARIRKRIQELTTPAFRRLEVTKERVLEELARVAFADMGQFADWGPHGFTLKPAGELDEDARVAVSELNQTVSRDGGSLRLKLHDKIAALDKLGKYLQMFKDTQVDLRVTSPLLANISKLTEADVDELRTKLQYRLEDMKQGTEEGETIEQKLDGDIAN